MALFEYNFLVLSLLFLVPGLGVYFFRPDLRGVIHGAALFSLPFAFTEFLFYPGYWSPVFLFGLADKIGFGIEDLLFVAGLGAFTSTAYPAAARRRVIQRGAFTVRGAAARAASAFGACFALVALAASAGVEMIYAAPAIMIAVGAAVIISRKDLLLPAAAGGLVTAAVYTALCLAYAKLYPGVFRTVWHTGKFLNVFVAGLPAEEIVYGFSAGFIGTVFYPFVFRRGFAPQKPGKK